MIAVVYDRASGQLLTYDGHVVEVEHGEGARWSRVREVCAGRARDDHVWTDQTDRLAALLVEESPGDLLATEVEVRYGELGAAAMRVHGAWIRTTAGYIGDVTPHADPVERVRWVHHAAGEITAACESLGLSPGVSGSSTGHRLWRERFNCWGAWLLPRREDVSAWDGVRDALVGGMTRRLSDRLIHRHGQRPRLSRCEAWGTPPLALPPDWRIYQFDRHSAYPAEMAGPLPYVWPRDQVGEVSARLPRPGVLGVARATVRLSGRGPAYLPVIEDTACGRGRYEWRADGEHSGTWPVSTLHAVEAWGARVSVEWCRTWPQTYRPFRDYAPHVFEAAAGETGIRRAAVKSFTRRLYGRFAMDRRETVPISTATYREWLIAHHARLRDDPMDVLTDARGCAVLRESPPRHGVMLVDVEAPAYAIHAQPMWAAEITARASRTLAEAIYDCRAAGLVVAYCDTDSLVVGAPRGPGLPASIRLGDGLGEWGVEAVYGWYAALASKVWISPTRCAVAGVPSDLQRAALYGQRGVVVRYDTGSRGVLAGRTERHATWCRPTTGGEHVRRAADRDARRTADADAE